MTNDECQMTKWFTPFASAPSGPAPLFEFFFRKTEIMPQFVDQRLANLRLELDLGAAHGGDGEAKERDPVGVQNDAVGMAVNQGDAFVQAQERVTTGRHLTKLFGRRAVGDFQDDLLGVVPQVVGELGEDLVSDGEGEPFEPFGGNLHGSIINWKIERNNWRTTVL